MADDNEKRELARQFIMASPCHELRQVIKDVRVLVADDALVDGLIPEAVRAYNVENLVPIEGPYGNMVVLCEAGGNPDDQDVFLDPQVSKYFKVTDHVKLQCEEAAGEVPQSEFRQQLSDKVSNYVQQHYKSGTVSVFATGTENEYCVAINSEKSNPGSKWSGRWRTTATVAVGADGLTAEVTGIIKNDIHYYEEGNVQMDTSKEIAKSVKGDSPEQLCKRVTTFIEDAEGEFHMKIDEMCQSLSDKSLKALRRRLPVSKQLFNFSSGAHKLASELTQGVPLAK